MRISTNSSTATAPCCRPDFSGNSYNAYVTARMPRLTLDCRWTQQMRDHDRVPEILSATRPIPARNNSNGLRRPVRRDARKSNLPAKCLVPFPPGLAPRSLPGLQLLSLLGVPLFHLLGLLLVPLFYLLLSRVVCVLLRQSLVVLILLLLELLVVLILPGVELLLLLLVSLIQFRVSRILSRGALMRCKVLGVNGIRRPGYVVVRTRSRPVERCSRFSRRYDIVPSERSWPGRSGDRGSTLIYGRPQFPIIARGLYMLSLHG